MSYLSLLEEEDRVDLARDWGVLKPFFRCRWRLAPGPPVRFSSQEHRDTQLRWELSKVAVLCAKKGTKPTDWKKTNDEKNWNQEHSSRLTWSRRLINANRKLSLKVR